MLAKDNDLCHYYAQESLFGIYMRTTQREPPNKLWIYVTTLVLLIGVLVYLLLTRGGSQNAPITQASLTKGGEDSSYPIIPGQITTRLVEKGGKGGDGNKTRDQAPTNLPDQQPESQSRQGNSSQSSTNNAAPSGPYAPIGCAVNPQISCVIKKDDLLYSLLGQSPDSELLVNGIKIKPNRIEYQTSLNTYNDEQMRDGQGKILSSTKKEYDQNTKTLTLLIGANPEYFRDLKPTEQRLLYISQTVRSFMAMFSESPDNFVKMGRVVNELGSWQPTP